MCAKIEGKNVSTFVSLHTILRIYRDVLHYYANIQELEYICSKKDHSGLHRCENLPPYKNNEGEVCNLTFPEQNTNPDDCVNWNQYYTECIEGGPNPYQGTISFDNIGLAWVAIFLVSQSRSFVSHRITFYAIYFRLYHSKVGRISCTLYKTLTAFGIGSTSSC